MSRRDHGQDAGRDVSRTPGPRRRQPGATHLPLAPVSVALVWPEIPPNAGNVARLCAATQARLHLVEPLGFSLEDRQLKRAGLDYWPSVPLAVWPDWEAFAAAHAGVRLVGSSSREGTALPAFVWQAGDVIVLGPETRGLPEDIRAACAAVVRIPIHPTVRSLNLSTAAGVLLYQALMQTGGLPLACDNQVTTP